MDANLLAGDAYRKANELANLLSDAFNAGHANVAPGTDAHCYAAGVVADDERGNPAASIIYNGTRYAVVVAPVAAE